MTARVLGVLAGNDLSPERLRQWAHLADRVVAADGGADRLLNAGVTPDLVIGDLDSASPEALRAARQVIRVDSQDDTDCDKLLACLVREGTAAVTLANLEGDLLDHVLGSLGSCLRAPLRVTLVLRRGLAYVLHPGAFEIPVAPGARVSLLPLIPCDGVSLSGVAWPLPLGPLHLDGRTSVSNRAVDTTLKGTLVRGGALLFVGHDEDAPPVWPEPLPGSLTS